MGRRAHVCVGAARSAFPSRLRHMWSSHLQWLPRVWQGPRAPPHINRFLCIKELIWLVGRERGLGAGAGLRAALSELQKHRQGAGHPAKDSVSGLSAKRERGGVGSAGVGLDTSSRQGLSVRHWPAESVPSASISLGFSGMGDGMEGRGSSEGRLVSDVEDTQWLLL